MSLAERKTLGRYRILRRLGAGAMGEVYLAEDPHIDRQLAIKTVRLGDGGEIEIEERRVRLMREAKAAGRLVHPHVVTLFDAGEAEDGIFYLAFEFVGGPDLAARQRLHPALTLGEVLRIGREAAEGLDAAHRQGIVHRDIKPSNILLDPGGGVKISDFGIAKMLGQATELTQTGSVVGSPHYLSPEQIRGEELDGRSDLFSLGVVLYELLTRQRPFAGDTITTLVYQILAREPLPIAGMRPGLPDRVERLVSRLLAKERDQRFGSAREVVEEILACERSLPVEVLNAPASLLPDEMGETMRMPETAGAPPTPTGALSPPPLPPPAPGTGATQLWGQGAPPATGGTAATRSYAPGERPGSGPHAAPPPPFGPPPGAPPGAPAMGAYGAAVPGSGSYAPAAPPKRFPWAVVVVLGLLLLLAAGGGLGLLLFLRRGGDATAAALGDPAASPTPGLATDPATLDPGASPDAVPVSTRTTADSPSPFGDKEIAGRREAQPAEPAVVVPVVPEPVATPRPRAVPAPTTAPVAEPPRREPARPASTPAPPPQRQEPVREPVREPPPADPEPEPAAPTQRFDREMASSLSIKFDVQPPETVVSVKQEGDRRFTVIGRAGDYDADKRRLPAYDLAGPGVHYVRLVHEGREVIYRLTASPSGAVTTITASLAPAGRRR